MTYFIVLYFMSINSPLLLAVWPRAQISTPGERAWVYVIILHRKSIRSPILQLRILLKPKQVSPTITSADPAYPSNRFTFPA